MSPVVSSKCPSAQLSHWTGNKVIYILFVASMSPEVFCGLKLNNYVKDTKHEPKTTWLKHNSLVVPDRFTPSLVLLCHPGRPLPERQSCWRLRSTSSCRRPATLTLKRPRTLSAAAAKPSSSWAPATREPRRWSSTSTGWTTGWAGSWRRAAEL